MALILLPVTVGVTLVVAKPLTNVTKNPAGNVAAVVKVNGMPSDVGSPWVTVRPGKAFTGRGGLEAGQDVMNDAARV